MWRWHIKTDSPDRVKTFPHLPPLLTMPQVVQQLQPWQRLSVVQTGFHAKTSSIHPAVSRYSSDLWQMRTDRHGHRATANTTLARCHTSMVWVEFNAPPDTTEVILKAVFTANHLTDTDKQNSTGKYKLNTNQKKVNNLKYSKTKLPWFSCLLQHSARKRGGLILQRAWAHTGRRTSKNAVQNVMMLSKTDRPDRAKTFPHQL